jgi:hypothetical protein
VFDSLKVDTMAKQEARGIFRLIAEAVLCASFAGDQPSRTVRENEAQQCVVE